MKDSNFDDFNMNITRITLNSSRSIYFEKREKNRAIEQADTSRIDRKCEKRRRLWEEEVPFSGRFSPSPRIKEKTNGFLVESEALIPAQVGIGSDLGVGYGDS